MRWPAGTMRSSPSAYVETRTRTGVSRGSQSAGSWPRSRSTMPVMPRAAAASRVRRYAAGDRSGSTTRSMRVWASYHSFSSTSPSRRGRPSRSSARVLSQAWWASPAISTTGTSGATASSIATVGSDGPRAEAVAEADQRPGVCHEMVTHTHDDVLGRLRPGEVEPLPAGGPLREVDVVVPQARDQPAAAAVVLLDPEGLLQVVPDVLDRALLHHHVDRPGPPRPLPQLDDPDVAEHEVGHAPTVMAQVGLLPDVLVGFRRGNRPQRRGLPGHTGSRAGMAWPKRKRLAGS